MSNITNRVPLNNKQTTSDNGNSTNGNSTGEVFVHPAAIVESDQIAPGTRVWAFAHVLPGVVIGRNCNIGDHSFIETGAVVGNNVTIKNQVCVWEGVVIEDDVFVGPNVSFTNDRYPRSPRMSYAHERYSNKANWLAHTVVEQGSSIGAGATVLAGITLGRYCLIAAGSVVTEDVEPHALMIGAPARKTGYVCCCGKPVGSKDTTSPCSTCGYKPASHRG